MKNSSGIAQLFLRFALGVGFLLPVLDRVGLMGAPGSIGVSWGNWNHFINYTNTLMPYFNRSLANLMGIIATVFEVVFGFCLIVGFKIKPVALGAAILTFTFGVSMALFLNFGAPFTYPVFVFTGACLVLSGIGHYRWALDEFLTA